MGIAVLGNVDGATKTAMERYPYFRQLVYMLASFGIAYRVHGTFLLAFLLN